MFQQVNFSDWSGTIGVIAFAASAGVFLFFLVGALRTPRKRIEEEAAKPLDDDTIL